MIERLRFPVAQSRGRHIPNRPTPIQPLPTRPRPDCPFTRLPPLEAKMQVFAPGISDHFRNRLTHTIEVTQIARPRPGLGLDERPYRSAGAGARHRPSRHSPTPEEDELNRQMQRYGDRFDHTCTRCASWKLSTLRPFSRPEPDV